VPGARLFVLAWASLLVGGMLMALRNFGLLPTHFLTLHAMQVGSALEMLLLSFALADRFNHIRREHARAQADALAAQTALVHSLQRHERELEQRVAERTEALAQANARLRDLALRDPLTALANRAALYAHLLEVLQQSRADGRPVTVLMIDLDGVKAVNDRLGHETGDRLLMEVADRLRRVARPADLVARLGGDEFIIVAEGLADLREAEALAQRLLAVLCQPIACAPDARIGASIGIAASAKGGEDVDVLLRRVDRAIYAAKAAGKGTVQWASA
jgi:diguanylate cyclase (GGDEF)-like protein